MNLSILASHSGSKASFFLGCIALRLGMYTDYAHPISGRLTIVISSGLIYIYYSQSRSTTRMLLFVALCDHHVLHPIANYVTVEVDLTNCYRNFKVNFPERCSDLDYTKNLVWLELQMLPKHN